MVRSIPASFTLTLLVGVAAALALVLLGIWVAGGRGERARSSLRSMAAASGWFLLSLTIYLGNGTRHLQVDTQPAAFAALSLMRHGWFDLTPFAAQVAPLWQSFALLHGADGLTYSTYPPGSTLACVPFLLPMARAPRVSQDWLDFASKSSAACCAALSVAFVFAALRRLGLQRGAGLATVAYGFGTTLFSTASQDAWQHGTAMLGLALALWGIALGSAAGALLSGLAFAWAFLSRPTTLAPALLVLVYLAWQDRRRLLALLAGALPLSALWLHYAWRVYGSPFMTGYGYRGTEVWRYAPWTSWPRHLLGTLFSANRGIFCYSPFLLAAAAGFVWLWPELRRRREPIATATVFALGAWPIALYVAALGIWVGGWDYGYRVASEFAVPMVVPLAVVAQRASAGLLAWALRALVGIAIAIHFLEYAFPNDLWNARADLKGQWQVLVHLEYALGMIR
ncbi:MAG: hypothetical protein U1E76_10920 [Planctomycetota bacterium]